ncbi:MAG: hypothetical protein KC591_18150 [Gemmatimonadetes bacterium]|nr:hypothetical protein [Gemmatimonadota bacterium]
MHSVSARTPLFPAALAALLLALSPGAARALVIDDFEAGSFNQFTESLTTSVQNINNVAHCISPYRTTILSSSSGLSISAANSTSHATDDQAEINLQGLSALGCKYEFDSPIDLTQGDFWDRVRMSVQLGEGNASVTMILFLWGEDFAWEAVQKNNVSSGTTTFFLNEFSSIDVTKVRAIQVSTKIATGSRYVELDDIRLARSPWIAAWELAYFGPLQAVWNLAYGGPDSEPSRRMALELVGGGLPMEEMRFERRADEAPGVGMWWNGASTMPQFTTWKYEVSFEELTEAVRLVGEPRVTLAPGGAMVEYDLEYLGRAVDTSREWITFDIPEEQLMTIAELTAEPLGGDPDRGLLLTLTVDATREGSSDAPLIMIGLDGERSESSGSTPVPEPQSTRITSALEAVPSVARLGTTFRAARAPSVATSLDVFDVNGRRVRTLSWTADAPELFWDGRDAAGRSVAPGVYWARSAASNDAVAKVVVVR